MSKKPTYEEIEQRMVELEAEIAELRIRDDSIIKELSTRYSSIFESVPASIVLLDKNGKIKDINPYHVSHIGKGKTVRKDYLNYNILEYPSVVAAGLQDEHKRVLNGESINLKSVHYPLTTGGRSRFFNIRGVPLFKNNKVIGAIIIHEDITKHKLAEEKLIELNNTLNKKVKERTNDLMRLNEHLVYSEEMERSNLASDLHDGIAQILAISVSRLKDIKDQDSVNDLDGLSEIQAHIEHAIREIRMMIFQLCPPILKDFDIDISLGFLIEEMNEKYHADIEYINNLDVPVRLIEANKIIIYRAVNELIINVIKHSGLKEAKIELSKDNNTILIKIQDHGSGFEINTKNKSDFCGFGLYSLSERFNNMGGEIIIKSEPGKGTKIAMSVPMEI